MRTLTASISCQKQLQADCKLLHKDVLSVLRWCMCIILCRYFQFRAVASMHGWYNRTIDLKRSAANRCTCVTRLGMFPPSTQNPNPAAVHTAAQSSVTLICARSVFPKLTQWAPALPTSKPIHASQCPAEKKKENRSLTHIGLHSSKLCWSTVSKSISHQLRAIHQLEAVSTAC